MNDISTMIVAALVLGWLVLIAYLVFRRGEAFNKGEVINPATHSERFAMMKLRLSLLLVMLGIWGFGGLVRHEVVKLGFRPSIPAGLGILLLASIILTYVAEGLRTGEMDFFFGPTQRGEFGFLASTVAGITFAVLWVALGIAFIMGEL